MSRPVPICTIVFVAITLAPGLTLHQRGSLWRYVALTPPDTIWLGASFPLERLADRINDSTYQLRPQTFGGAERIRLFTSANGHVRAIDFQYEAGAQFNQMRADYASILGPPTGVDSTAKRRSAFWQDKRTRFELLSWHVGELEFVAARMSDISR